MGFIGTFFGWIFRTAKTIFSSSGKDFRIFEKEAHLEKKEKKEALDIEIDDKLGKKGVSSLSSNEDDLEKKEEIVQEVTTDLSGDVDLYLKDKNHDHVKDSQEKFDKIIKWFDDLKDVLKDNLHNAARINNALKKSEDSIQDLIKLYKDEWRAMRREYRLLKRAKKEEGEYYQKKATIFAEKKEILKRLVAIFKTQKIHTKESHEKSQKLLEIIKEIYSNYFKLKEKTHQKIENWENMKTLLGEILNFIKNDLRINQEEKMIMEHFNQHFDDMEKLQVQAVELLDKKDILNKEYEVLLVKQGEEIQSGESSLPGAA